MACSQRGVRARHFRPFLSPNPAPLLGVSWVFPNGGTPATRWSRPKRTGGPNHDEQSEDHDGGRARLRAFGRTRGRAVGQRRAALAFLAREKGGGSPVSLPASGPTLAKFAAEYVERRSSSWKPSTMKATLSHLDSAILPAFGHLRVGSVVRADITRFFHEYGRRKPDGANRSHEILRTCSIAPSRGTIGPTPPGTRARASSVTGDRCGGGYSRRGPAPMRRREPGLRGGGAPAPADGCRPGEIRRLRWCEAKDDRLALIDAKTGPRHVQLGEAARELLRGLAETTSKEWGVPRDMENGPLSTDDPWRFRTKARDEAGIVADARLHDLRHAHASHSVMNGESLHVAGRLLGHRRATTTNRYGHLNDATLSEAAERVAVALESKLQSPN